VEQDTYLNIAVGKSNRLRPSAKKPFFKVRFDRKVRISTVKLLERQGRAGAFF
jgi:hypothetical protein